MVDLVFADHFNIRLSIVYGNLTLGFLLFTSYFTTFIDKDVT